jgi:hypothetical protein
MALQPQSEASSQVPARFTAAVVLCFDDDGRAAIRSVAKSDYGE